MGKARKSQGPAKVFDARGWMAAGDVAAQVCESPVCHGVFGGTWSLIDLYRAITERVGACDIDIMTWVAAGSTFEEFHLWLQSQRVRNLRIVVDSMAVQRARLDLAKVEGMFGADAIRVIRTHAKGAVFYPVDGSTPLVVQSSANLNKNARLESYFSMRGEEQAEYWRGIFDEIFEAAPAGLTAYDGKKAHEASCKVRGVDGSTEPKQTGMLDRIQDLL